MALLLNIDCATKSASVALSNNEEIIALKENCEQKEHASFLHIAIKDLLSETGVSLKDLDAVAVTSGPGSYTGLRVGLASAKGICFALNKPLITLNTLEVMTVGAINFIACSNNYDRPGLYCPMIDARRMEVFTAIYNNNLENILAPCAIEITNTSFNSSLDRNRVYFFGSGSEKSKDILEGDNAVFLDIQYNAREVAILSKKAFDNKQFSNIAYSEPFYLKEFYSTQQV